MVLCGTVLNPRSLLGLIFGKKEYHDWISLRYSAVLSKSVAVALWERWKLIFRGAADFNGETGPRAAQVFFESHRAEMLNGTAVLWEEHEDYYKLMVQLEQKGEWAFCSEKQNDPKEDGNYDLDEKGIVPWDDNGRSEESLIHEIGAKGVFIGAIDPAYVEGGAHDFTVITTVLIGGPSRTIYVLDSVGGQWRHEIIVEHMVEMNRRRKYQEFILESNGAQRWLMEADAIKRNHMPIRPLDSKDHKHSRIRTLFLAIQSGSVKLSKRHLALWEQMFSYPHTAHDDYIDSLAMAVSAARSCAMGSISIENQVEILQNFAYRSSRPSSLENALSSSGNYLEARLVDGMTRLNK